MNIVVKKFIFPGFGFVEIRASEKLLVGCETAEDVIRRFAHFATALDMLHIAQLQEGQDPSIEAWEQAEASAKAVGMTFQMLDEIPNCRVRPE